MIENLPRRSASTDRKAMLTLAVAKLIKDRVYAAERAARAYLAAKVLDPGDRKTIVAPNGQDVGTLSMSKPRTRGGLTITDPTALAEWCMERGIDHGGTLTISFPEWFTAKANLEAVVRMAGGEMPPGIEDTTEVGDPTLTIRQTDTQAAALLGAFTSTRALLEAGAFAIEAEEEEADR